MASRLQDVLLRGLASARPLATTVANGTLYYSTDTAVTEQSDGTVWSSYADATVIPTSPQLSLVDGGSEELPIFGFPSELAKTNQGQTFKGRQYFGPGQYNAVPFNNGSSGAAKTIDWDNSNIQFLTLTAPCTLTLSNPVDGGRYVLATDGNFAITWPASVEWPNGGAAPAPGVGQNLYVFLYWSAFSKYMGAASVDYSL